MSVFPSPLTVFRIFLLIFWKITETLFQDSPTSHWNADWKYIKPVNNLGLGIFKIVSLSAFLKVLKFLYMSHAVLIKIVSGKRKAQENSFSHIKNKI